ncbi:MAG: 23S rRNA (guanosine(2251)-2'-O)-methyltransferase RlmB [Clostridia bacterium]|nr:23S rRNA (guanosine(2251)-2'-O)-methyltransferase RlmB [Clostridia bacterium]
MNDRERDFSGVIEGRNALSEALKAGVRIDKLYVLSSGGDRGLSGLVAACRKAGAVVVPCERRRLDEMSHTGAHQGVIAAVAQTEYASIEDMLKLAGERGERPMIVVCDHLCDVSNLGAIIRTAEVSGAHGVIIPSRRGAGITPAVAKASAGAVSHMLIARVPNIVSAIKELKDAGVWVFGADMDGTVGLYEADLAGPSAIVIGAEGEGLSRLARENCDFIVSIPMFGRVNSLNASAAAAVLLYEAVRRRHFGGGERR